MLQREVTDLSGQQRPVHTGVWTGRPQKRSFCYAPTPEAAARQDQNE